MRTYTLTDADTVETLTTTPVLLDTERPDTAPILPTQIRTVAAGPKGAEWVRAIADYQDAQSVGYASVAELLAHHDLDAV